MTTVHIAEEIKNPARVAIISALGITHILGWMLNIVICICIDDAWPDLLTTLIGLPAGRNILYRSWEESRDYIHDCELEFHWRHGTTSSISDTFWFSLEALFGMEFRVECR